MMVRRDLVWFRTFICLHVTYRVSFLDARVTLIIENIIFLGRWITLVMESIIIWTGGSRYF